MNGQDAITLRQYIETLFEQYKEAHKNEHKMLAESNNLARENLDIRLESMNQFRNQINDERGSMVSIDRFEARIEALEKTIETHYQSNERRISTMEKTLSNLSGRWTAGTTALGVGLILLQLFFHFVIK
jgi:hypothetical protein